MSTAQLHEELGKAASAPQSGSPVSGPGEDTIIGSKELKECEKAEGELAV